MKYAIYFLEISCAIILSTWVLAGQPTTPSPVPQQQQKPAPAQPAAPAQPKTAVKVSNNSGYNATITYHYFKIPENNPTRSSTILEKGATAFLELLPNTSFSFSLTADGVKSPDVQINPGEYSSGFYEIKAPASPLIIPQLIRQATAQAGAPTTQPAPTQQPTTPTPPAK